MDNNVILFGKHIRLGEKCFNLWTLWISTTRWCCNQGKCYSKIIYPRVPWIVLNLANLRNVAKLLLLTPPWKFHQFAWNFAHSICGPSWQRILIFSKQEVLVCPNDMKLRLLFPHESLRLCTKLGHWAITTTQRSLNWCISNLDIGWLDSDKTWYKGVTNSWRSGGSRIIYLVLCPHQNNYVTEIHRGGIDWHLCEYAPKITSRWRYYQDKSIFAQ